MALLKIARMGHPVLASPAAPVADPRAPEIRRLIADMAETMLDLNAAGIAAPQVHVPLKIVMFRVSAVRAEREGADELPLTVLINPALTPLGDEMAEDWEGCLSVPGLRGLVPRHVRLHYRALDPEGGAIDRTVEGFHARVVQHECDHLDGKLYPQRMTDLSKLVFESEWRWHLGEEG
jgi:peptide deformylase